MTVLGGWAVSYERGTPVRSLAPEGARRCFYLCCIGPCSQQVGREFTGNQEQEEEREEEEDERLGPRWQRAANHNSSGRPSAVGRRDAAQRDSWTVKKHCGGRMLAREGVAGLGSWEGAH